MAKAKSTRAFRTISEAAEELELQSHVLRFWESKFPQIQPMKRSGGRRFYRPEDIEFLRGIKILLHREKHPIKDVQKLIRIRGAQSVLELGRSAGQVATPKAVKDTDLLPNLKKVSPPSPSSRSNPSASPSTNPSPVRPTSEDDVVKRVSVAPEQVQSQHPSMSERGNETIRRETPTPPPQERDHFADQKDQIAPEVDAQAKQKDADNEKLEDALERLKKLKSRWQAFE